MRIVVTGASGLVGRSLEATLAAQGHDVVALGRHTEPAHVLGERVPLAPLRGADVLVHAAWDFRSRAINGPNVAGMHALVDAATAAGVPRIVVVSSMSAAIAVDSEYGRQKRAVEAIASDTGAIVIRPGLVWSNGAANGLVASLRMMSRLPVVPIPKAPDARLHLVEADDLALVLACVAHAHDPPRLLTVAHPEPLGIDDIIRRAGATRGRRPVTIPLPPRVFATILGVGERFGLPFTADNLRGLTGARRDDSLDARPYDVPLRPFAG